MIVAIRVGISLASLLFGVISSVSPCLYLLFTNKILSLLFSMNRSGYWGYEKVCAAQLGARRATPSDEEGV